MRTVTLLLFAALTALLLAVPVGAGDYGCSARYYTPSYGFSASYSPHYYSQPYYSQPYYPAQSYAPVVTPPANTCVDTPNGTVCNHGSTYGGYGRSYDYDSTLYRIAPDLATARLAQQASEETLAKFQQLLAKQAAEAEARADKQANRDFQLQVVQLLSQRQPQPQPVAVQPPDGQLQQLQAENAQMREALNRVIASQQRAPAIPQPPPPDPEPPQAHAPPPATGPNSNAAAVARVKPLLAKSCMPCHAAGNAEHLTDLTKPELLTYEKCTDSIRRMITNNPKKVMPKGKPPGTAPLELVGAVEDLAETAPHDPRLK